ncbi:two-component response regulator-like APRR1 isoform X1 [Durio zibethinus]|uniref:Two-component response regulator-like APRR1 isoform X1 n=1 Tax=Durio zibethinus TaxID=66656 RepID=A0A6P5YDL4_DURZI|nr:two-component response regulator-like APRR1 isoform X1 [Durio zibethinus]
MESKELNLNKECKAGGGGGYGFTDRSKVRILLCDNDTKSCEEVFSLLLKCSYQGILHFLTSVRSARQVIDALNAEGPEIDIILAEVDLPMTKGMKMLKYIMRNKELRHIPVIMMSAQDEVSIVVKCLRLGAADYLVKPLRTNELLNLWTHMWRRQRELGLAEKNILSCDFDLVASDPSDANTNSTTLFSDDTDDRSRKSTNPEMVVSTHQEDKSAAATIEPPQTDSPECRPDVPGISDRRTGQFSSGPKRSELKIGESSAFFTYVKSSAVKNGTQVATPNDENATQNKIIEENLPESGQQVVNDAQVQENGEAWENCSQGDDFPSSSSIPDSLSVERSSTPPVSMEFSRQRNFKEDKFSQVFVIPTNEPQHNVSGLPTPNAYLHYMSGVLNQVMMPSSTHLFQNNFQDPQNHTSSAVLPQYNHLRQCLSHPHVNGMASFPYYQVNMCRLTGQMPTGHSWPSFGNSSSSEVKLSKVDRREAALIKFKQKRKERCFDKKVRYVNRKRLAERRPRVRGQFVRKNGVTVDLNGQPASADFDEDEEEEEQASRDSSPEDDTTGC